MAYGVTTRMYLVPEPARPQPVPERSSNAWRLLGPDERLRVIDRHLRTAA
jgi:hypothetical protein